MKISLKPAKTDIVIHHMQMHGEIDANTARKYNVLNLPDVINRLRGWGHYIDTVMPNGKGAKYVLAGVMS